jgi:acyl carrier protein
MAVDEKPKSDKQWTDEEARALVHAIVADLAPSKRDPELALRLVEDLGYHSLALLELAFALEDEFNLPTIDEATARSIVTVADVERHVITTLQSLTAQPAL